MSAQIVLTNLDLFNKIAVEKTKLIKQDMIQENINKHRQNNIEELKLWFKVYNNTDNGYDKIVWSYWEMIHDSYAFPIGISPDCRKLGSIAEDNTDKIWNQEEGGYTLSGYPNPWRY